MSDRSPLAILGLTAAACLLAYKLHSDKNKPKLVLPPSPKSYPLIGNLLSIPQEYEHLAFMKIEEEVGSKIFSLTAFGTTIVVLNDKDDATNLLEKRSSIYSDRNMPPMVSEPSLLDWEAFGSLVGYTDRWRKYRRLINPWLNKQASAMFHESQERAGRQFLLRLLEKHKELELSDELESELFFSVASTLLHSVYGYEAKSVTDRYLVAAQKVFSYLTRALLSSNFLVNTIPALVYLPDWFPGTGWKQVAKLWRQEKEELIDGMYKEATEKLGSKKKEKDQHMIVGTLRNQALRLGLSDQEADDYIKHIAITLYAGGTDTTVNALTMFFMAMVLYPEVQMEAQKELDSVLGDSRLPTLDDLPRLKYIGRVIQEVLRWGPPTPLAVPHACFRDDNYKGYDIPKGAIIMGNVWAMTRDPEVYKDPETFEPDRFLDPSVPPSPVFGWGRRRCPGVHFAEASLFSIIAPFLTLFSIEAPLDEHQNKILPSRKMINALVLRPETFNLRITPRSAKHEDLLRSII